MPAAIESLDGPGGGEVRERSPTRPASAVDAVLRPAARTQPLPHRAPLSVQLGRRAAARQRHAARRRSRAPEVVKLGHVVLELADFQATCGWYTRHFGFIPSDVQVLPDGSPAVTFMRLDLGDTPADHHTLALAQGFVAGLQPQRVRARRRRRRRHGAARPARARLTHAWGIGRHILGSQIFDYWQDPWGDKHEHYCDGDVFTADVPTASTR